MSALTGSTSALVVAAREAATGGDALELVEWLEAALESERRRQVLRAALPELDAAEVAENGSDVDSFQDAGLLELAARSGRVAATGGPL
jgi:hypothetical protein